MEYHMYGHRAIDKLSVIIVFLSPLGHRRSMVSNTQQSLSTFVWYGVVLFSFFSQIQVQTA